MAAWAAEGFAFDLADELVQNVRRAADAGELVLEDGEKADGLGGIAHPAAEEKQECADLAARERRARGWRDVEAPALEDGGDAAGKLGFGRDEGDSLVGRFQRLAEKESSEEGFLAFVFRFDEGQAVEGLGHQVVGFARRGEVGEAFGPVAFRRRARGLR